MQSLTEEEKNMFGITPDIIFPVELSMHLRDKLKIQLEENRRLKSHIEFKDGEIKQLRVSNHKAKSREEMSSENCLNLQSPQVAVAIVELKRKNRDMTSQVESMKNKMQILLNENERLKDKIQEVERQREFDCGDLISNDGSRASSSKSNEEIISAAQQLSQTTNKMMEYRRQCQQLRIELRTALRALAHEIGDGANSKNVMSIVSNPTWRGRQQYILTLNQKITELQNKLAIQQQQSQFNSHIVGEDGDGDQPLTYRLEKDEERHAQFQNTTDNYSHEIQLEKMNSFHQQQATNSVAVFSATQRHLAELHSQDKKKHEHLEKLTEELEELRSQAKTYSQERSAFKARTKTLENQIRSLRLDIEEMEMKLKEKEATFKLNFDELHSVRHELMIIKMREKTLRENSSIELHEIQQSLARERAVVVKLQAVLNERQELVHKMDGDIKRLQTNLDLCCNTKATSSGRSNSMDIASSIKAMKSELQQTAEVVKEYEKERQELLNFVAKLHGDVEDERQQHSETQTKLVKSFAVIDQANGCISICLEEAQITGKQVLVHVESVRSLIREIKSTGSLYSLDTVPIDDVRKLKTKVGILCKENGILHQHARKSFDDRRRDLEQYGIFASKLRNEFLNVLQNATCTLSRYQ